MNKPSEIQQAYNELINCINEMAKSAGGLNVTDMVAIKGMTDAVIKLKQELATASQERTAYRITLENLETENEKLKKELEAANYCAKWNEHELTTIKASLPKIKADAVRGAMLANGAFVSDSVWLELEKYAEKLGAGE